MLPTFQVRGLRCCSSDSISGAEEGWADVQLDNELHYELLIREHPETTLSYVDDDDGEIITVGSTEELIARVDELQPLSPVIFDLLVSPSSAKYESAIRLWGEVIKRTDALTKDKGKGKAKEDILGDTGASTVARSGILVDLCEDSSSSSKEDGPEIKEDPAQMPLLGLFEIELEKIFQALPIASPPEPEIPTTPQRSPSPIPQQYPSEVLGQTLRGIAQNIGRVANELRNDLPSHAQPTVEALNTALHSSIRTFTTQLQAVALEAAAAARNAAQVTREMNVSELEATGKRMKELAETVGHIAIQGAGVAKEEVDRALGTGWGAGQAGRVAEDANSEVGEDVGEIVARQKEQTKKVEMEECSEEGKDDPDVMQWKFDEKLVRERIREASNRNQSAPIDIADAVSIPAGSADPTTHHRKTLIESSSEDEDDLSSELPGIYESRNGRETVGRRRRHFDLLRPQGGHVDGPARSNTFPHWGPGHHMFHPRHPRNGRHGPHHGGPHHGPPPPHHPHFGMPGSHPHPPPPPPPPPHHPHHPHGPHGPGSASPPPPPPPPPPPHEPHGPHRHAYPPPPPAPPFPPHHTFRPPPPFWESDEQSINSQDSSATSATNPLDELRNSGLVAGKSEARAESNSAPAPLFPFIRRAHTIGSDREQWVVPHPSEREQGRDQGKFIPPVAAMPPIPSTQHVMRRFPSLSSFHSSSNGQVSGGLRAQASVPSFRPEQRKASVELGQNPFATPPRQPSPVSEQAIVSDAQKPKSRALPGEWPQAVLIPPPPPPAPMDAFASRGLHRASSMGVFATRGARSSLSDTLPRGETNPFVERRKRRESRMENKGGNDWDYYSRRSVPGTFPLPDRQPQKEQQKNTNTSNNDVDRCVAQLVEMGYAEDESESALERLRVYAQIAEGQVEHAVELLEEERKAWGQRNE